MKLPALFKGSDKKMIWEINVVNHPDVVTVITKYGRVSGKISTAMTSVKTGKNIGKINETSPYEQGIVIAKSKWNKKKDQGYMEENDNGSEVASEATSVDDVKILPMLAHDFDKRGKHITFPCYTQPKIDGVRAVYKNGSLNSRTGKEFPGMEHILNELNSDMILDGELYSYTLSFEDIVGVVRKKQRDEKTKQIIFIVYDTVSNQDYIDRYNTMKQFFDNNTFNFVKLHQTHLCESKNQISEFHEKYTEEGYEGVILRNLKGRYETKRSTNLQKFKIFKDAEFKITGFTEGVGVEKGLVIWVCETSDNKAFSVRPRGSHDERKSLYINAKNYIGKYLSVRYFEYTNLGIPRFPTGITIRDYE